MLLQQTAKHIHALEANEVWNHETFIFIAGQIFLLSQIIPGWNFILRCAYKSLLNKKGKLFLCVTPPKFGLEVSSARLQIICRMIMLNLEKNNNVEFVFVSEPLDLFLLFTNVEDLKWRFRNTGNGSGFTGNPVFVLISFKPKRGFQFIYNICDKAKKSFKKLKKRWRFKNLDFVFNNVCIEFIQHPKILLTNISFQISAESIHFKIEKQLKCKFLLIRLFNSVFNV